jgi:hypothetical protein
MTGEVSDDYLITEEGASDAETIEVDPETEAALTEAGIDFGATETPPAEESEETIESETEQAPETEHPAVEQVEETPEEQPLFYGGKYKTQEELENAYREAEREMHAAKQEAQRAASLQNMLDRIGADPEGQKTILRLMQPPQPEAPQIPQSPEEFDQWAAQMVQRDQAKDQQLAQLQDGLNRVYAHLENQAVVQKHGDTLTELQPYLEQVNQGLGPQAQYYPQEQKILMAKGLKADADGAVTATQQQTEQEQTELQAKHREKVLGATVEPANNAAKVAPKIVDTSKMTTEEYGKYLTDVLGVKVVSHD